MRVLLVVAILCVAHRAEPCAPAPPPGATVTMADEEAVIAWDAATHVETFIRRATFESSAKSFGFLVPTPTKPELGELPDSIFASLADTIRPKTRHDTSGVTVGCITRGDKSAPTASAPPRILQTARVAGFDATTLAADDAGGLAKWLAEHGFARSPALDAWLQVYVNQHWTITAFVVAANTDGVAIATRVVKMTFPTDRPFYPYREPDGTASSAGRTLRVFFVADKRYAAMYAGAPWAAKVPFAAKTPLPAELGSAGFLSTFEDVGARTSSDEVFFAPSADAAEVRPPDIVINDPVQIPLEGVVLAFVVAGVLWLLVRKRRK